MTVALLPTPIGLSVSKVSTAKVGTARPTLVMLMASVPPLPTCPSESPSGSATTPAMTTATTVSTTCSLSRCRTTVLPVQLLQGVMESTSCDQLLIAAAGQRGPRG